MTNKRKVKEICSKLEETVDLFSAGKVSYFESKKQFSKIWKTVLNLEICGEVLDHMAKSRRIDINVW